MTYIDTGVTVVPPGSTIAGAHVIEREWMRSFPNPFLILSQRALDAADKAFEEKARVSS